MTDSILLSLSLPQTDPHILNEEIEEMKQLALTLNYNIASSVIQNRKKIDASTYFGKGKLKTTINQCKVLNYSTIFINNELKPGYFKRIQKLAGNEILIVDRTKLILDIFNNHAKTIESKKQIELASLEYMMPRLIGKWTHLERQMGGIGTTGGPGEKQIEIDRRLVRKDISKLKNDLTTIEKQKKTQRKSRKHIFKVSLAGYTNSGKSSLLKTMSGYKAYIKDQLFATLDTTTKKVKLNDKTDILVSDTVGFLRNLPHELIASFQSTLSEIKDSDLIIKLVDITSTDIEGHINTINQTLKTLNCNKNASILVFNKIDKIKDENIYKYINNKYENPVYISSLKNLRINQLLDTISEYANLTLNSYTIKIPHAKSNILNDIYKQATVINRVDEYKYTKLEIKTTKRVYSKLKNKL